MLRWLFESILRIRGVWSFTGLFVCLSSSYIASLLHTMLQSLISNKTLDYLRLLPAQAWRVYIIHLYIYIIYFDLAVCNLNIIKYFKSISCFASYICFPFLDQPVAFAIFCLLLLCSALCSPLPSGLALMTNLLSLSANASKRIFFFSFFFLPPCLGLSLCCCLKLLATTYSLPRGMHSPCISFVQVCVCVPLLFDVCVIT